MTEHPGATAHPAFAYPCPACRTPADLAGGCPGCGRPPDPDAAEVIRLDAEIAGLVRDERRLRHAHAAAVAGLTGTRQRRDALAARVRASVAAPVPGSPPGPAPPPPAPSRPAPSRPEASPLGIQALLFLIGGLLLGIGAIVFTVVAWTTFGVVGQAMILAAGTGLALAIPPVAGARRLRGTAETFAVIGVLLVLLDGYAAWRAGLVGEPAGSTWAGLVAGGTALVAVPYARWTRLASPQYAGLVLAQPVLPLLAAEPFRQLSDPAVRLAAVGYLLVVLAAGNLARQWHSHRPAAGVGGDVVGRGLWIGRWLALGGWLAGSALAALAGLVLAGGPGSAGLAGGALLAGVLVLAGVAWLAARVAWVAARARLAGAAGWVTVTAGLAGPAVALAAGRTLALAWPGLVVLTVAAVAAGVAVLAGPAVTGRALAGRVPVGRLREGARGGGLVVVGIVGVVVLSLVLAGVAATTGRALAGGGRLDLGPIYWQLPVAVVLLVAGSIALLPAARYEVVTGGLGLLTLAVPPALALPWWAPVPAGLLVATGLAMATLRAGPGRRVAAGGVAAAVLAGHALLLGLADATARFAALAGLVLLGLLVAARAAQRGTRAALVVGRVGLLVGLLAVPPAAVAGVVAAGTDSPWPGRAALLAAGGLLLAVLAVRAAERRYPLPGYVSVAAGAVHVLTPVAILAGAAEPELLGAYAAAGAVGLAALGLLRRPARPGGWLVLRAPVAGLALVVALPQVLAVLVGPYSWLGRTWTGTPAGVGLLAPGTPGGDGWPAGGGGVLGLVLLVVAAGLAGWVLARVRPAGRRPGRAGLAGALLVAPVAGLAGLAELGARWPTVPAVSLGLGVALVLVAALRRTGRTESIAGGYGLVLAGAGLAGSLPAQWSTLAGLAVATVAASVVGVAGQAAGVRVAGWLAAVGFAAGLAVAAPLAAGLPLPATGFTVLGVATVALAAARWLPGPVPGAVEAAANGAAVTALLLAAGAGPGRAGGIAALWGAALAVRALRGPGTARAGWAVAAAGCELLAWWLLLASREVTAVEAYTLPAGLAALAAGWWVRRSRPGVGSWTGYGPALVAAALPSLYLTLVDPAPLRRLLLGAAAVAVVLAGARRRLQAPVVLGGAVAALVAVRELGLLWQRLPTWVPLTVAGLLLVGLAATYERRRRDLARLRAAVGRMT